MDGPWKEANLCVYWAFNTMLASINCKSFVLHVACCKGKAGNSLHPLHKFFSAKDLKQHALDVKPQGFVLLKLLPRY